MMTGRVINLAAWTAARAETGPMPASLRVLQGYWAGLCRNGVPPSRDEIDPRGLGEALPHAFLAERIAPGQAMLRLAGQALSDLVGSDARGMPLSVFFDPVTRIRIGAVLDEVFLSPATADLTLDAERGIGRPALAARLCILPVRGDAGRLDLALGALVPEGTVGRTPRRFAISATRMRGLARPAAVGRAAGLRVVTGGQGTVPLPGPSAP